MEAVNKILHSLSIDQSLFYQLGIFILLFAILRGILFERLLEILDLREGKTLRLEKAANQMFADAEKLAKQYDQNILEAKNASQSSYDQYKKEIAAEGEARLKQNEERINSALEERRRELAGELAQKKSVLLKDVDSLSKTLVEKFTN